MAWASPGVISQVTQSNSTVVINEGGVDGDFRVEGDTDANLFFVDAGNDRVGISMASPTALLHIEDGGASDTVIVESSDPGATSAPNVVFYRNSGSAAANDVLGRLEFRGRNAANNADLAMCVIEATAEEMTGGGEDGRLTFKVLRQGAEADYFQIGGIATGVREVVFNDGGTDIDFRIEDNQASNIFHIMANNGSNAGQIGFFGAAPVVRPSAYTQTYSTADKTHAARTASTLTDNSGGTADTTIALIPPVSTPAMPGSEADIAEVNAMASAIRDAIADLAAQVNNLITDQQDTAQALNSVIDDLQALGLLS